MVQLRRVAFSLCCALAFTGCAEKIDARQLQRDNGLSYKRGSDDPFTGTVTNVPVGEFAHVSESGNCTVGMKKGLVDGKVSCKTEEGASLYEASFREGEKDGKERVWYAETDTVVSVVEWENGRRNGIEQRYHPTLKKLISEINWNENKKDGRERHWNFTGEEVLVDLMWSGGKHTGFDKRGEWEVHFVDGQYDGVRKNYSWLDSQSAGEFYVQTRLRDQLNGGAVWAGAWPGAIVTMEETWARGVQLTAKKWTKSGRLSAETTFKDGQRVSEREWHENGALYRESYFQHDNVNLGSRYGEQARRIYDEQGKLVETSCYLNDCSDLDRMFPPAAGSIEPVAAAVASATTTAAAAGQADDTIGQCVFPKTRNAKNGHLELVQPIMLYPAAKAEGGVALSRITSYLVSAQNAGLVQIADPETNQPAGWVNMTGFEFVHQRNCI